MSTVISIFIVVVGIIGLTSLPVEQYPSIAPPTIQVETTYTGANAQTVLNSVIAPLEESINGALNMTYMTSTATNTGRATINVYFTQGYDPDMAAIDVQNRVSQASAWCRRRCRVCSPRAWGRGRISVICLWQCPPR